MSDRGSSSLAGDDFDSDDSESTSSHTLFSSPIKPKPAATRCQVHVPRPVVVGPPPPGHKYNIIQKLGMRSTWGKVRSHSRAPEMRLFSRLPGRLAFFLRDVVPHSALTAGHVFMGFTGCGQFLLSYTQTTTDSDLSDLNIYYHYRLHWWLFQPYAKAKKVAEVTLFANQGVVGNLHISISQWPRDFSRLVVHGYQVMDGAMDDVMSGSVNCFLTVTYTPSLNNCRGCIKVASSYDADDMAEAWNSCVRLSCLRHGATVHTSYDLVPPHPRFEPKICLKREGCVVINTGNFLHSISVDIEALGTNQDEEPGAQGTTATTLSSPARTSHSQPSPSRTLIAAALSSPNRPFAANALSSPSRSLTYPLSSPTRTLSNALSSPSRTLSNPLSSPSRTNHSLSSPLYNPISVNIGLTEFSMGAGSPPGVCSPASFPPTSDSENTDAESEVSFPVRSPRLQLRSKRPLNFAESSSSSRNEQSKRHEKSSESSDSSPSGTNSHKTKDQGDDRPVDQAAPSTSDIEQDHPLYQEAPGTSRQEARWCNKENGRGGPRRPAASDAACSASLKRCTRPLDGADSNQSFKFTVPSTPGSSDKKRKLADEAYDLTDDNFTNNDDVPDKLSTFRRKRLAEKKYEFTEDEDQNIFPITTLRGKENKSVLSRVLRSNSHQDLMVCVSERTSETANPDTSEADDCWTDMLEGSAYPELFSPGGCIKKDANSMSPRLFNPLSPKVMTNALSPRAPNTEYYCRSKFTRRYIEVDDELISVLSEVEDDELGINPGCYSALPLEVHGSGYTQMQMISNTKAERLQLDCVRVQQRSLDLEHFCHETATRLCADADKKFWFCNDYDVEVMDVDPETGDVVVLAVILIQAAMITKSQSQKFNVSSLSSKQYQASFKFCWNMETGHYSIVDSDPLKEISGYHMLKDHGVQWNPARVASAPYLKTFKCESSGIKVLTNESVIRGVSLKAIVDPDNLVGLIMNDLE